MSRKQSGRPLIKVGARASNLSKRQVEEAQAEYPHVLFEPIYMKTVGDLDRTTSLRTLDKTDFFTREIDEMLLRGECRIAIHSAKDLPEPLPKGLELIALTKGVDPSDSLVLREGERLSKGFVIATSSVRRKEMVRALMQDVAFVDIRGTIEERLAKLYPNNLKNREFGKAGAWSLIQQSGAEAAQLQQVGRCRRDQSPKCPAQPKTDSSSCLGIENGEVDGVVIAEAALIRLGLTCLNRIQLPGETVPLQGRLAILAREGDVEMRALFNALR